MSAPAVGLRFTSCFRRLRLNQSCTLPLPNNDLRVGTIKCGHSFEAQNATIVLTLAFLEYVTDRATASSPEPQPHNLFHHPPPSPLWGSCTPSSLPQRNIRLMGSADGRTDVAGLHVSHFTLTTEWATHAAQEALHLTHCEWRRCPAELNSWSALQEVC